MKPDGIKPEEQRHDRPPDDRSAFGPSKDSPRWFPILLLFSIGFYAAIAWLVFG